MTTLPIEDPSALVDLGGTIGVTFIGLVISTLLVHNYHGIPGVLNDLA